MGDLRWNGMRKNYVKMESAAIRIQQQGVKAHCTHGRKPTGGGNEIGRTIPTIRGVIVNVDVNPTAGISGACRMETNSGVGTGVRQVTQDALRRKDLEPAARLCGRGSCAHLAVVHVVLAPTVAAVDEIGIVPRREFVEPGRPRRWFSIKN